MAENMPSGHKIEELKGDWSDYLRKKYYMYIDGAMRLTPGNWIFPLNFKKYSDLIHKFTVKPTDIFVLTYPKSGTTWIQEIVWNLVHNPDGNHPAANMSIDVRFPNIEVDMFLANTGCPPPDPNGDPIKMFSMIYPDKHYSEGIAVELSRHAPDPRMIKTHLNLSVLPPNTLDTCKVIYIAREPRDVVNSNFHFARLNKMWGFNGNLDEFVEDMVDGRAPFGPYWEHMKLAWDQRKHPNMCFVYYEDLKADAFAEIRKIDKFLGTERTEKQIQNVAEFTSFSQMKERSKACPPTSNDNTFFNTDVEKEEGGFFRKGEIGDWKNRFSSEQLKKLDSWIAKNITHFGEEFKYKATNYSK